MMVDDRLLDLKFDLKNGGGGGDERRKEVKSTRSLSADDPLGSC
jgi:hypothetical protein